MSSSKAELDAQRAVAQSASKIASELREAQARLEVEVRTLRLDKEQSDATFEQLAEGRRCLTSAAAQGREGAPALLLWRGTLV